MKRRCDHCRSARAGRLRPSRTDPDNMLCNGCWDRFGGSLGVSSRDAARRRATRPPTSGKRRKPKRRAA